MTALPLFSCASWMCETSEGRAAWLRFQSLRSLDSQRPPCLGSWGTRVGDLLLSTRFLISVVQGGLCSPFESVANEVSSLSFPRKRIFIPIGLWGEKKRKEKKNPSALSEW